MSERNEKVANFIIADETGSTKIVLWDTKHISLIEDGKIKQGDVIANSGNSGRSFGIHCHWELRKGGICYNPLDFVNKNADISKSDKRNNVPDFDANKYLPQNIDEFKDE